MSPRRFRRRRGAVKPGQPVEPHVVADRCGPTGKVRYRSEGAAFEALKALHALGDQRHQERRAYKCPLCAQWHLTKRAA